MSFRKISLAVLCIALLQNAMAQRWVSIAPSSEAGAAVFIDAESISQSDEYLKAWFKYSFSTQQAGVRDTTFRSYLELLIVDCKKNIQATRSVVF